LTPIEISAAIQAGKAAFDTIRGLAETVNKSENAADALQTTTAIADLGARVTEMQSAIYQLSHDNDELRRHLAAATDLDNFKKRYRYEESVCWKYDGDRRIDGPFCPNCVDEGKEYRLNPGATMGTYSCVVHKVGFETAEHQRRRADYYPVPRRGGPNSWMA